MQFLAPLLRMKAMKKNVLRHLLKCLFQDPTFYLIVMAALDVSICLLYLMIMSCDAFMYYYSNEVSSCNGNTLRRDDFYRLSGWPGTLMLSKRIRYRE